MPESLDVDDYVLVTNSDNGQKLKVGEKPQVVLEIKTWLKPTEFDSDTSEYKKHLNAHVSGTGRWVYETRQYKRWHDTDEIGDLWIRSVPGAGKSVVAADLVRTLKENEDVPVLFFFFRNIISSNRSPRAFLRDACCQLLDYSPRLQTTLNAVMEQYSDVGSVPFSQLFKPFSDAMISMKKVYCVLDAMDEMDLNEDAFIADLLNLGRDHKNSIKLALTSRQLPYLEALFKGSCLVDLRLDRIHVDQDIAKYIDYKLTQVQNRIELADAESVKRTICERGQGLFLYARLMMDECIRDPDRFLSGQLPGSLSEMYTNLLEEHAARSDTTQEFQSLILGFVTHCQRPLRLIELTSMLNSMPDRGGLSTSQDTKTAIRNCCGPLLEICEDEVVQIIHHSLTEYLTGSAGSHVRIEGADTKRFPVLNPESVHARIAAIGVTYMMSGCFQEEEVSEPCTVTTCQHGSNNCSYIGHRAVHDIDLRYLSMEHGFVAYAIDYWDVHASKARGTAAEYLFEALDVFLQPSARDFQCWQDLWQNFRTHKPAEFGPLHVAAYCGLKGYMQRLLARIPDVNSTDAFQRTPLMYAAFEGHADIVAMLIEAGARYDVVDVCGLTAVHLAARRGHVDALEILLRHGADPLTESLVDDVQSHSAVYNKRNETILTGTTALHYICHMGHVEALRVLLAYISPNDVDQEAVFWATKAGHAEIVQILLNTVQDINRKDARNATAIFYAAQSHDAAIVRLLLAAGADPNITSDAKLLNNHAYSRSRREQEAASRVVQATALQAWAGFVNLTFRRKINKQDMIDVFEMLVDAGCDVNARVAGGQTALFCWNLFSPMTPVLRKTFVSCLLRRGADAKILDDDGSSVLHRINYLDETENEAVVLLCNAGANINQRRTTDGETPLIAATRPRKFMHPAPFHALGADLNAQDLLGNTAFHYACMSETVRAVHIDQWLKYASPTIRNNAGQLPLANFVWGTEGEGRVGAISKMIQMGVDIESRDYHGRTLLLQFLAKESTNDMDQFIQELLRLGADAKAVDFEGKSALHLLGRYTVSYLAKEEGDTSVSCDPWKAIIDAGGDINAQDHRGKTIFQEILSWEGVSWQKICSNLAKIESFSSDIHMVDLDGRTAVHTAATIEDDGAPPEHGGQPATRLDYVLDTNKEFDVNAKDHRDITLLHFCAEISAINVWKVVQAGADLAAKDYIGRNALHYAAAAGQSDAANLLISLFEKKNLSLDAGDFQGRTPLHEAAQSGKVETVLSLLNAGADIDILDRQQRSALHHASEFRDPLQIHAKRNDYVNECQHRNDETNLTHPHLMWRDEKYATQLQEVVHSLLAAGADPFLRDVHGRTASDAAITFGNDCIVGEIAKFTQSRYDNPTGKVGLLDPFGQKLALERRASMMRTIQDFSFSDNNVALLERIFLTGDDSVVEAIVARNIRLVEDDGSSAIHLAVRHGKTDMVKKLLPHVPDINAFHPPLLHECIARETTNMAMFRLLIDAGVNVDIICEGEQEIRDIVTPGKRRKILKTDGLAAIHILATGRHYWYSKALSSLLDAGADPNLEDQNGRTALHICVSEQIAKCSWMIGCPGFWSEDMLDILLERGANVNAIYSQHFTLQNMAPKGHRGPKIDAIPSQHYTPINIALRSKRGPRVVQKLLHNGADSFIGETPAIASAINVTDIDTLIMLLEAGVDPNAEYTIQHGRTSLRVTPLLHAAVTSPPFNYYSGSGTGDAYPQPSHEAMIDLLLDHGSKTSHVIKDSMRTVMQQNAMSGGLITASMLKGFDLEQRDEDGKILLHWACDRKESFAYRKRILAALMLIERGSDVNAIDAAGNTPLHYAMKSRVTPIVQALLEKKADVTIKNNDGLTPWQLQFESSGEFISGSNFNRERVEILLEAGSNPLERGKGGTTILHQLAPMIVEHSFILGQGYDDPLGMDELPKLKALYRRLISLGCDPNAADDRGDTPMFAFVAAEKNYNEVERVSPPNPVDQREMFALHDIFRVNKDGNGLLHVVAERDDSLRESDGKDGVRWWEMLIELGLDPRLENHKGLTPLDVAAAFENELILELYARKD